MPALYEIIQVRPRSLVIYPHYEMAYSGAYYAAKRERAGVFSDGKPKHDLSKEANQTKGRLSDLSIRRLRYAVQLLDECSPWVIISNEYVNEPYPFKLAFLTLTLPCRQGGHSDEFIKRTCLMPFITALQKKFGDFSYVWKAETQDNGNIHFHLTLNAWIYHRKLREAWNRRLKAVGYLDEYRREQRKWHSGGFKPRPELFKTWSLEQQGKAYDYGMRTNWSDPNTIDVHSVLKIDNLAAYLIKYMSKKEDGRREIKGKIWGCSRNLSYTNKFEAILDGLGLNTDMPLDSVFKKVDVGTDFVKVLIRDKDAFEDVFPAEFKEAYNAWLASVYHNKQEE